MPFVPNRPDLLAFEQPEMLHTVRKGHRILGQVPRTWFPFIDTNARTSVLDIVEGKPSDCRPCCG